jgi:hypothetical protein
MEIKNRILFKAVVAIVVVSTLFCVSTVGYYLSYSGPTVNYAWTSSDLSFVTASDGSRYNCTGADVQKAIYAVDNGTGTSFGWVYIPSVIVLSNTLKLTSHVRLFSNGNGGFVFSSGINKSLIENWDQSSGNNNITVDGLILDGNCMTVVPGIPSPDSPINYANGVELYKGRDNRVINCKITNVSGYGVYMFGMNDEVLRCDISHVGANIEGTGKVIWRAIGVSIEGYSGNNVNSNTIHDCYSNGITLESRTANAFQVCSMISGNVIYNCDNGIYNEHCNKTVISDNVIYDCYKGGAYYPKTSCGIRLGSDGHFSSVNNTVVHDNIIRNCGNGGSNCSIWVSGDYNDVHDNYIDKSNGHGIYVGYYGKNSSVDHNTIVNCSNYGIFNEQPNTTMIGNVLSKTGQTSIYYAPNTGNGFCGGIISDNQILNSNSYGMFIKYHGCTISNNHIIASRNDGIRIYKGNETLIGNEFRNIGGDGVEFKTDTDTNKNCTFIGNHFDVCSGYAVNIATGDDGFIFIGNTFKSCSSGNIELGVGTHMLMASMITLA